MDRETRKRVRRMSMQGTLLFLLGVIAVVAALVTGSLWLGLGGLILLVPAVIMLHRVGKSL